jgi:hypothetical protein
VTFVIAAMTCFVSQHYCMQPRQISPEFASQQECATAIGALAAPQPTAGDMQTTWTCREVP